MTTVEIIISNKIYITLMVLTMIITIPLQQWVLNKKTSKKIKKYYNESEYIKFKHIKVLLQIIGNITPVIFLLMLMKGAIPEYAKIPELKAMIEIVVWNWVFLVFFNYFYLHHLPHYHNDIDNDKDNPSKGRF